MMYIYSECKISFNPLFESILDTEAYACGYCCYSAEIDDPLTPAFIYFAVISSLCGSKKSLAFSGKLMDYLCMTGHKPRILSMIRGLLAESGEIHIDGIVNFRLGEFTGDIVAFFDMMLYADTIRKGFKLLICRPISLLEF